MPLKIKQDHSRFREIIRGRIKENLRKYIQKGEMIGKKGKDLVSIPLPEVAGLQMRNLSVGSDDGYVMVKGQFE